MDNFIEKTASPRSLKMRKLLLGVGANDAKYIVRPKVNGKYVICPYYDAWKSMITRSYSEKTKEKHPTYKGCSVTKEWLIFSNFRAWMETQDWQDKQLDKDILIPGNKEYNPSACIFVSSQVNNVLVSCEAARGEYPQGVGFHKNSGKYVAYCNVKGKLKHLGYFSNIPSAEFKYLTFKSDLIKQIAYEEESLINPKLQAALLHHAKLFEDKANKISL